MEPQLFGNLPQSREFDGWHIPFDRQMEAARLQVLTKRQHVAIMRPHVAHDTDNFIIALP